MSRLDRLPPSTPVPLATPSPVAEFALDSGSRRWTHSELAHTVDQAAALLRDRGTRVLASLLDNGPAWVVADLAAAQAGCVHVPLPLFFSRAQIAHVLHSAGVDTLLLPPEAAAAWPQATPHACRLADQPLCLLGQPAEPAAMPAGTRTLSFTSGTTGAPKGVCLSGTAMQAVADGLVQAMAPLDIRRHLCVLPLGVLLENIAGLMAPLQRGATCVVLPLKTLGLEGSSRFDAATFHAVVLQQQPHSLILLPQMLRAWVGHLLHTGQRAPASLKIVAVGGAAVGERLVQVARSLGIPACEGYGLSEGASVQTLNLPGADRPGSAGKALPHARLRVAADGEIEVAGSLFSGYLGDTQPPPAWWPTGDLGEIDADGFLHLQGRKKHVLITAYGRNLSPEWVETALRGEPSIAQAVVFGEAQPALSAVLWAVRDNTPDPVLQAAVDAANRDLPDYARVQRWVRGQRDFSAETGMATANGRPQRAAIAELHAQGLGLDKVPG